MPFLPALQRQRQVDLYESEVSLVYIESSSQGCVDRVSSKTDKNIEKSCGFMSWNVVTSDGILIEMMDTMTHVIKGKQ